MLIWKRFAAWLIDVSLAISPFLLCTVFAALFPSQQATWDLVWRLALTLGVIFAVLVYFLLQLSTIRSGSPGRNLLKLKIVNLENKNPSWKQGLIRTTIGFLPILLALITGFWIFATFPVIWILLYRPAISVADLAAKTRVIAK